MKKLALAAALAASILSMGAIAHAEDIFGPDNGGTPIEIWHYFEGEADALNKICKEYNELQSDIYVTATFVSREELMKQYTIGAVSGELPDIGMVDSPDMASYISLGVFDDIQDELEAWGELDNFYEGPLNSCRDSEGRIHGLPNNSNCLAILCNMDMLKAAGIDKAPETMEEFLAACEATTDPDNDVYGFAMSAISNEEGTFQFIPWLYSTGGNVGTISSDESIEAFQILGDLIANGWMSKEAVNWGQGDALNAWAAEKACMLESGTWQIALSLDSDLKDTITWEYAYVPMPKSANGAQASVIGGENFGVCTGAADRDACIAFLEYMMTAQNNADWCEMSGKLPVRGDAVPLKDFWTEDPRYKVFNDSMNFAVPRGPHPQWPTISEALYTAEQAVLLGEKDAATAAADAAAVIDPIVAETPLP